MEPTEESASTGNPSREPSNPPANTVDTPPELMYTTAKA